MSSSDKESKPAAPPAAAADKELDDLLDSKLSLSEAENSRMNRLSVSLKSVFGPCRVAEMVIQHDDTKNPYRARPYFCGPQNYAFPGYVISGRRCRRAGSTIYDLNIFLF